MKKLFILAFLIPLLSIAQNQISGTFSPSDMFSKVFLYQVTPNYPTYISYSSIASDGNASIALENNLAPGMYRLVFGIPQDEFYFDFIYNGKEDVTFKYDANDGVSYISSEENLMLQEYNAHINEAKEMLNATFGPNVKKSTYFNVFKTIGNVQDYYETESEGMIANHFIKTGRIPNPSEQLSVDEFLALEKTEFFKNIDFNDTVLQHSDYLTNASRIYVLRFSENNEQYKENIKTVAEKASGNYKVQKSIMERLWYDTSSAENLEIANFIADNYLLSLAEKTGDTKLITDIKTYSQTAVGAKAPNFSVTDSKTLYDLNDAQHYLLIFWSSTCSHCLKELPQVKKFLEAHPNKQLQVVAFGLEDEDSPWEQTITQFPTYTHVYGAGKWENKTARTYNIVATPTYFILDSNKTIVAKPENLEALETALEAIK
ncbi:TlpA family protein disulfide reductase [Joostella sp. CR20]|uniref:TlpA family protein disulfide reductase n=1 Tax=Joostella sp. CR20 TaxID=2804312 RepID=UPI00313C2427